MFYSPQNEQELINTLNEISEKTFIVAGGTDLIIKIKKEKVTDYSILDITKINLWKLIKEDDENIYIGSLVTMTELCRSSLIYEKLPALYWAAYELGSTQIRNKATIGGNVSNASQSADTLLSLFSYGATVKIINNKNEEKIVNINEFVTGREKNILNDKEVVKEFIISKENLKNSISTFRKIGSRKSVTISKVSCSIKLILNENEICDVKVFLGAVGERPVKASLIESQFIGKKLEEINLTSLQEASFEQIEKAIPTRVSKYYKRIAIEGLMEEVLGDLKNYGRI